MGFSVNDRYLVFGKISKGETRDLHVAIDRTDGWKRVAMKTISSPLEEKELESLRAEYRCLSRLKHPNIVQIHDFGYDKENRQFYFTEEFVEGPSLQGSLGRLPFPKILEVTSQICQALAHLHDRGIIHGDLKPSNILIENDRIKLVDFGLACLDSARPTCRTLPYLAPEIISGGDLTPRSDLYSLGVLLFELTTGQLPFQITDFPAALRAHHLETPVHPGRLAPSFPPAWGDFILRLLNKDPEDRPAQATQLIREINLLFGTGFPTEETTPSPQERLCPLPGGPSDAGEKDGYSTSRERTIRLYEKMRQEGDESHLETLAELYYEKGDVDRSIEILKNGREVTFTKQLLTARGWIKKGDLNAAHEILQAIDPDSLSTSELARLMNNRGILCFYRGDDGKSEGCFEQARKYYLKIGDKLHAASVDNGLANLMLRRNRHDEAERLYLRALKAAREVYDLIGEGSYLMNLGALCQQRGEYPKALEHYYEGLIRFQRIGYRIEIPRVLNNLANTHLQMGNLLQAKELIQESLKQARQKRLPYLEAYGWLVQGDIGAAEGNLEEAEASYREAERRFSAMGAGEEEALARTGLLRITDQRCNKNLKT